MSSHNNTAVTKHKQELMTLINTQHWCNESLRSRNIHDPAYFGT